MPRRKLDKLDLKIAEIEAKVVVRLRHEIIQDYLDQCKRKQPWCPYLRSTKICPSIQKALRVEISATLQGMGEQN